MSVQNILSASLGSLLLGISVAQSIAYADDVPPAHVAEGKDMASDSPRPGDHTPPAESSAELSTIRVSGDSGAREDEVTPRISSNRVIEEIVVTAQKREEKLQDVPISIQAFSGDALAARGIETTQQLGQSVPSLQFTSAVGFTLLYMRGIGTDNFIPSADPSIATYIDGIYIPQGQSTAQSLGNVQRVEVLKGPQGTLFGRNATGGAISIVTEEPGQDFKASLEGELGNFDSRSAKASVTNPLTDWLSFSASALYSRKDSYYKDIYYDTQPDALKAARLKINIRPADSLSLSLTSFYSAQQGLGSLIGENIEPSLLGKAAGIQPGKDDYTSTSDLKASSKSSQRIYYGNLTWTLPWFDIKVLGSDQYILTDFASSDFDGSPLPSAAFEATNEYTDLQTAELQIVSNADSWGADKFEWVTGLYYLQSDAGFDPGRLRVAPQALQSALNIVGTQLGNPNVELPVGLQNLLALAPNTPLSDGGLAIAIQGLLGTKSYSAYAQGTYTFTDWLDLTLGGRFQRERRFLTKAQTGVLNPFDQTVINLPAFPLEGTTAKNFSPKAVLSFHPRNNALLYASYSVGFKSGTYNIVNIYTPPNYIKPEEVRSYEIGAKVDFLDGLLRLNGAVFYNDIKNLQSGFVAILSGGAVRFQTAGAARTKGVEFDGTLVPFPGWNPGLAVTANAAYVDATYTDFSDGSGFQPDTGLYQENIDFSGNKIARSPDTSGGIGLVQTIEGSRGSYEIAVDEYFNSGYYFDAYNTVKEDPYSILNAHISYLHEPWNVRVTLFGKNLLDERYHLQQFQTDFGVIKTLAAPREYGMRINWNF